MNIKILGAGIALFILGVLSIATSSITIECYNKHESYKKEKKDNFNFAIATLVSGILAVLSGCVSMAVLARKPA